MSHVQEKVSYPLQGGPLCLCLWLSRISRTGLARKDYSKGESHFDPKRTPFSPYSLGLPPVVAGGAGSAIPPGC